MTENFVTLDIKTYESLQKELAELRQHVVYLEQARLIEPYGIARQRTLFNIISTIRGSLDLEKIFQQTAREVRQLLDADRVGIFRFYLDSEYMEGEFVSEDVREGYSSALDAKVRDRCFGEKYVTYYEQGQVQAIADIYNASLSDCHIQILSRFQIKANLVVPLVLKNKLWGLLCIHQCSNPRCWQAEEIEFMQQIAIHLDVAIYQAQLLAKSQQQAIELQQVNQQLEQNIAEKTARLIAVDRALGTEIHYRKQADRNLAIQSNRLQNVATYLPGAIFQFTIRDKVWKIDYISEGIWDLAGITATEMTQDMDSFIKLIHPDDLNGYITSVMEAVENCTPWHYEARLVKPNGEFQWWEGNSMPTKTKNGEVNFCGLLLNITKRKQAEEELQKLNAELEERVAERTLELQASEARFQNLAANVPGVICQLRLEPDGTRTFPYVSPGCRNLLELEPEEFSKIFDIVYLEDREELERKIMFSAQELEILDWEWRVITASGKVKWISISSRPERQSDGAIVWDGLLTDVSDRRQAELERDRFFNLSVDMLCIADFDGYFKRVNPAFEYTLGYTVEELLAQPFINLVHLEDREATVSQIDKIRQGATILYFENRYLCKDGSYKWLSWASAPFMQDRVCYAIARDITDRKQSEEALQISEERFRLVAEQTGQLIYDYDLFSGKVNWSGAIEKITGYSVDEFQNFDLQAWEEHIHPDDRQLALEMLDMAQKTGTHYHANYQLRQKDGNYIYVDDNGAFLRNEEGTIYRMLGTMGNITDRKQAEIKLKQKTQDLENTLRELQRTQTQLVQSEKMSSLGQLVAGVAHEINNPVNFIFGNLAHANEYAKSLLAVIKSYQKCYPNPVLEVQAEIEAAELDFLIEDFPKLIGSMQIGAERIREIIAALRNFSRIDESDRKLVDIHTGIDSTLMILHNRIKPKSDSPEIKIIKNYGNLPQVECYPGQLNQVFMNILVNALDALEERDKGRNIQDIKQNPSFIIITTKVLESEGKIKIKISDNGLGIPENIQNRIFDPFFTTKGLGKGTGLGMSISYQIITEKHHGTIECSSVPGKGAEFIIELPICLKKT